MMSIFRRRAVLFGALLFGIGVLIGVGLAVLLRQPQGWPEQQRQLTELARRQDPGAVLLNITADGTWTPAGVQGLSVRAEYLRPSGERLIATFEAPLDVARVALRHKPPDGPGPVDTDFLQVGAEVQNRIRIGPQDAFRVAHGAIARFVMVNGQGCRIADAGLVIEPKSLPPQAYWVVMCTIAPSYVSVVVDPYTGTIIHETVR